MTGIWTNVGDGWELGLPQAFRDEATLHKLIEKNPQMLPLAGSPRLAILGSEVQLGTGYTDILAVEQSGRPVVIEVKLASNPEARRAVISQIIAYSAFLHGHSVENLEQGPLRRPLANAGYGSILEAVQAQDQEGAVDSGIFPDQMQQYLNQGNFRLVLVLDEVSVELSRIVAYLDAITVKALTIDLITLQVFEVNGAQVALPQRVSPDIEVPVFAATSARVKSGSSGVLSDGSDAFRASTDGTTGDNRELFDELLAWAERLAQQPNVRLLSYSGEQRYTLLPRILPDDAGLITIWNDRRQPYISVWRSVFERLAPNSIDLVEKETAPIKIGQGNTIRDLTPRLLDALTTAYQEASRRLPLALRTNEHGNDDFI